MSERWTPASCPCQEVKLRVRVDLSAGTGRCNCSWCTKRGWWSVFVPMDAVEVLEGKDHIVEDDSNPYWRRRSCACGAVVLYGISEVPGGDGPRIGFNVRLLDDVDLHGVPVTWLDGLSDTWAPLGTVPHVQPEPVRAPPG